MEGNAALCALFITCMSGTDKGLAHGNFITLIHDYLRDNGLDRVLMGMISGGREYQPDLSYIPRFPDPNQTAIAPDNNGYGKTWKRMAIEIEFLHRSPSGLRKVGHNFLNGQNSYASLFVVIKVWKQDATTGHFAAAAVVWERTHPGPGAEGNVIVRQALDFGTQRMSQLSINTWAGIPAPGAPPPAHPLPPMIPPVLATDWRRPNEFDNPLQAFQFGQPEPAIIQDCCLILPKEAMFYRVSCGNPQPNQVTYVTDVLPTLQDCAIDMRMYQRDLNW